MSIFSNKLPREAKIFIATEPLLGIGIGLVGLVLNLHILVLGYGETEIGKITSYGSLLQGVASLPAGYLASVLGRKPMLLSGLALMSLGVTGYGLDWGISGLYISQTLWAIGMTCLVTSEIQLLFQYCQDRKRESQAYGFLFAMYTLFSGIGILLGGFLPRWVGNESSLYQNTLFIGALSIAGCFVLRWMFLPTVKAFENPVVKQRFTWKWPKRNVWLLSFLIFLVGFNFNLLMPFLNVLVKFRMDWSDEWVSLLLSLTGIFHFAGSLLAPWIREKWGVRRGYLYLFASNILIMFFLAMVLPSSLFLTMFVLRGGLYTMLHNLLESESMSAVAEEDRNLFASLRSVFRSLGGSLAAVVTGIILSMQYYGLPFFLTGIMLAGTWLYFQVCIIPLFDQKEREETAREASV